MTTEFYLLAVLGALLLGLAVGKAWERYKLRDGRWIDRRRLRETPHYMLGLNFLVDNQVDQAVEELTHAASTEPEPQVNYGLHSRPLTPWATSVWF